MTDDYWKGIKFHHGGIVLLPRGGKTFCRVRSVLLVQVLVLLDQELCVPRPVQFSVSVSSQILRAVGVTQETFSFGK